MDSYDDTALALMKFGVGQPVPRKEDPTLLRGQGRYTDDISLPGQAYAVMVRSPVAHGILKGIDTKAASEMPGVLAILTHADLETAGLGPLKCAVNIPQRDGSPMKTPPRPSLAVDRVRFVGEAVACVVAETRLQARDAAEAVVLDIEELPAVTRSADAVKEGAPQLHADVPGNLALDFHYGDAAAVKKAFAEAAHVTRLEIDSNRVVVAAMEPRSAIGSYDAANDRWTLRVGCQGVMGMRGGMARDVLKVAPEKVRVLTGNVGGSFGMKSQPYPEYGPLLLASKRLGRAVKWTDERSESFLSDHHGRDHQRIAELALDKDGRFLAVRLTGYGNAGAYIYPPLQATTNAVKNVIDVYRTPAMEVNSKIVFTNTTPVGAYRGAGRPEANYFMERLIDTAAREMGIDKIELRRRNHIKPGELPYKAPSGMNYDSGEFTTILDKAVAAADWQGFDKRKQESAARGKLRGRGIGAYLEVTGPPAKEYGGIRFEADGKITMLSGTLDYGQGHATPFAQVLCDKLGIPFERFQLLQGDSDQLKVGGGTGGSKSALVGSQAFLEAGDKLIEQGKQIAAHVLEASAVDIEFARGRFVIAGTDRGVSILELADKLRSKVTVEDRSATMEVAVAFGPGAETLLPLEGAVAFADPRLPDLGVRVLAPAGHATGLLTARGAASTPVAAYDALRLELGVPDGSRDLVVEKALLLENGFDELNGVDWQKGCYMGQELTARTKYRALIRKRLLPVRIEGELPAPGTTIFKDGQEVGELRSGSGNRALAMLRLDALQTGQALTAGEARLSPEVPSWMRLPEAVDP